MAHLTRPGSGAAEETRRRVFRILRKRGSGGALRHGRRAGGAVDADRPGRGAWPQAPGEGPEIRDVFPSCGVDARPGRQMTWFWLLAGCAAGMVLAIILAAVIAFLRMIGRGPGDWF